MDECLDYQLIAVCKTKKSLIYVRSYISKLKYTMVQNIFQFSQQLNKLKRLKIYIYFFFLEMTNLLLI